MTTIGSTLVITGELTCTEDITIEGRVDGEVLVRDAMLTIAPQAQLRADVRGARVLVFGKIKGAIVASERIDLAASATVEGSLSSNHVVLAEGTTFNGRIDMDQRTIAARVAHFKASQGTASV